MRKQLCLVFVFLFGSAIIVTSNPSEARSRHDQLARHHQIVKKHIQKKKYRITRQAYGQRQAHGQRKVWRASKKHAGKARGVSLAGVTPVLAAKARQIVASCGSTIVSAVSRRGIRSNHPSGRAVDLRGNPGCVYAQLKGWPGGYSTDYAAAGHVHISYNPGGQEWGLRFAHGKHGHGTRQYAGHGAKHHVARRYAANHYAQANHHAQASAARDAMQSPVQVGAMHAPH
jgi:hypothetical protein